MIKIKNNEFNLKYCEINFRQRNYKEDSIVTIMGISELLPRLYDNKIISGNIEFTIDSKDVSNLSNLENKKLVDVKITISLLIDGNWENNTYYDGIIKFGKIIDNNINFNLSSKKGKVNLECEAVMISLYTTSTSTETLNKCFNLEKFYEIPISKKIGNNEVLKYFVKN